MIKKLSLIAFYILLPLGVIVLLGFAVDNNQSRPCKGFKVVIDKDQGLFFLDSADVVSRVYKAFDTLDGKKLNALSLNRIEDFISKLYYVEKARVYRTLDGYIVADIRQRKPIARVINSMNENYYIDNNGRLMRHSQAFTPRVPVVSGFVSTRYSPTVNIAEINQQEEITSSERLLTELFEIINFIRDDRFFSSWIDQIYVTRQGEFELVPRNGAHTIEFGKTDDMEIKFNKLLTFYKNGLTQVGWGHYNRINVKFENQVVCSK